MDESIGVIIAIILMFSIPVVISILWVSIKNYILFNLRFIKYKIKYNFTKKICREEMCPPFSNPIPYIGLFITILGIILGIIYEKLKMQSNVLEVIGKLLIFGPFLIAVFLFLGRSIKGTFSSSDNDKYEHDKVVKKVNLYKNKIKYIQDNINKDTNELLNLYRNLWIVGFKLEIYENIKKHEIDKINKEWINKTEYRNKIKNDIDNLENSELADNYFLKQLKYIKVRYDKSKWL